MCEKLGLGVVRYHIKCCWVAPPPSPTGGLIFGLINWTGQNNPRKTRRPPISQSRRMENTNSWLTIPNDLSLTIKLKNFYSVSTQNIPVSGTKCRVSSRSVWGTRHSLIQQPPEMTGICSAFFESRGNFSSEMLKKCTRKSLSFDSGKASSFQLCYSPF